MNQPGMEPTQTSDPTVPAPSPEFVPSPSSEGASAQEPSPEAPSPKVVPAASATPTTSAMSGRPPVAPRAAAGQASVLSRGIFALIGRHKLETVAVLLLGVGGAVYPPVWLLGVIAALPSRKWDLRDKWTGLVAPVLLVIVSTVLIVVLGGKHPTIASYALEAWLGASRVSRIAAALGAAYLFWRLSRRKREPKQPPWERPHRLG